MGGKVHPLVRTNYWVRCIAFGYCFLVIGLHCWDRSTLDAACDTPAEWIYLALQFLVYPHLAYWRASRAADGRRAELNNLFLDSFLLGACAAQLGFPTWISYALFSSTTLNAMVNRGPHGLIYSLSFFAGGAALWGSATGFPYTPGTSPLVTTLCFFGSVAYACIVGYVLYVHNRRLRARERRRQRPAQGVET